MKVYVDELPKSCRECPCSIYDELDCCWCKAINGELTYITDNDFESKRLNSCPLHSLAEHDKAKDHQIELLNKGWEKLKEFIEKDHDWNLERGNNDCALGQRWVLEKMQELEQEFCE
jgi:hypothetical protein